jgi:hypothetical protein
MSIETPHLQWPFQLNPQQTNMKFVEQDTPAEVAQCVAFVLSTQPGELVPTPALGMPDPTFREGGATEAEIAEALHRWEPRATFTFTSDELVRLAQKIGISVT